MKQKDEQKFTSNLVMIGCSAIGNGRGGIGLSGNVNALITETYISDSDTGIELENHTGRVDIKKNSAKRVKNFVVVKEDSRNKQVISQLKNDRKYETNFKRKIKELLNLEAQAKFLKNYEELKQIRFLKAYLKIEI